MISTRKGLAMFVLSKVYLLLIILSTFQSVIRYNAVTGGILILILIRIIFTLTLPILIRLGSCVLTGFLIQKIGFVFQLLNSHAPSMLNLSCTVQIRKVPYKYKLPQGVLSKDVRNS